MKHQTHSSHAYRGRNISSKIHPAFPGEAGEQPAHLGSQSAVPPQEDNSGMNQSLAPSQDMSLAMGAAAGS
jgi:hypothetical protein